MQPVSIADAPGMSLPGWPIFDARERRAVMRVLRSGKVNYWTGQEVSKFEAEFATYLGVPHAIAVANGTLALELALQSLGIGAGDEVIVPSRTFIATASAVAMRGAVPVVADIDPASQNMTAEAIAPLISERTRAIIPVHLAGWPCDMDSLMTLARNHRLWVIEDCAQAHGARYRGKPVGTIGHVGAYSFCQDKIMSTGGEGGMLVTADDAVRERAWSFKDHGKNEAAVRAPRPNRYSFRPVHDSFGTNWRMTEMQAAIGREQLRKLDGWVARRRRNALRLAGHLMANPAIEVPVPPKHIEHSFYKLYALVRPDRLRRGWDRDRLLVEINRAGVPCFSGASPEIYLERAFQNSGLAPRHRCAVAQSLGQRSLMFLVHPTLKDRHIDWIASTVCGVLGRAAG